MPRHWFGSGRLFVLCILVTLLIVVRARATLTSNDNILAIVLKGVIVIGYKPLARSSFFPCPARDMHTAHPVDRRTHECVAPGEGRPWPARGCENHVQAFCMPVEGPPPNGFAVHACVIRSLPWLDFDAAAWPAVRHGHRGRGELQVPFKLKGTGQGGQTESGGATGP